MSCSRRSSGDLGRGDAAAGGGEDAVGAVQHLAPEQALQLVHPLTRLLVGDHAASVALSQGRELVVHERHGDSGPFRPVMPGSNTGEGMERAARAGGLVTTLPSREILS